MIRDTYTNKTFYGLEHSYASRAFIRSWVSRLELTEVRVLGFIIDRTIAFGRKEEAVSVDQMIEGISSGDYQINGVNKSKSQIIRAIKTLCSLGVIKKRQQVSDKSRLKFNIFSVVLPVLLGGNMLSKLKESKRSKAKKAQEIDDNCHGENDSTGVTHDTHTGVTHDTLSSRKETIEKDKQTRVRVRARGESVGDVISKAKSQHVEARTERAKEIKTALTTKAVKATWNDLISGGKYSCPSISSLDAGLLCKQLQNENMNTKALDFLTYTVQNWDWLIGKHFHYRKINPAPQVPAPRFLAHNIKEFVRLYGTSEVQHDFSARSATVDDKKFKKLQQENSDMQQQLFEYKKTIDSMVSQANELKFTLRRYKDISDKSAKEIKALQDIIDEIDPNRKERLFQIAITEEVPEWDGSKDKED